MTSPAELLTYIDRSGYERACADLKILAVSDVVAVEICKTAFERFYILRQEDGTDVDAARLATHARRGYSVLSDLPPGTPTGTPLGQ